MLGLLLQKYKSWKRQYQFKKVYCTNDHRRFYDIAARYLPSNEDDVVVDLGAGEGQFVDYLDLDKRYKNIFLLDGHRSTVEKLKGRFNKAIIYKVPDKLPFENSSVSYLHCSHLIEHLYYDELYQLLKEIHRVLDKNGILIVSSPMLYSEFYNDLSHVRPYNPDVLLRYFCDKYKNASHDMISEGYSKLELVFRYRTLDIDEGWGSNLIIVDFMIQLFKAVLSIFGVKRYSKNGYTVVLKKIS